MRTGVLPKMTFVASCSLALFTYGLLVGTYGVFPYSMLKFGKDSLDQAWSERETVLGLRPVEFLAPSRYDGNGVTVFDRENATPGLTFLTGFFAGGNEMRLIRLDGSIVARWPVKYFEMFFDQHHVQPHDDVPKSEWNVAIQGSLLLPDGSVVFNFNGKGSARLDRCGRLQWTVPRMTHHVVSGTSNGDLWIPSSRFETDTPRYPKLRVPYREDTLLRIARDGAILDEISVLEILYRNELEGFLLQDGTIGDLTHVNDVEELTPELAAVFPQFTSGDLLLSMRRNHLLLVVDPSTLKVKWYQEGPWYGQHDPDFMDDGRISVFSNNEDSTLDGSESGGSTIIEVDPATGRIERRYGHREDQRMYTPNRGDHQRINGAKGHILITESKVGRIFEVDVHGRIVWEYVNRYDEADGAVVASASRYPETYFTVDDWTCP